MEFLGIITCPQIMNTYIGVRDQANVFIKLKEPVDVSNILDTVSVLIAFGGFVVTYLILWFGARLYFKRVANEMNNSIRKK